MSASFMIRPGALSLSSLRRLALGPDEVALDPVALPRIEAGARAVRVMLSSGEAIYGVNTGFGALARTRIPDDKLRLLQERLVLSHAAGTGPLLPDHVVRLVLALKVASLAHGRSGVRREVVDALLALVNARAYPCIPVKGSVGASGDLAPLAHLAQVLIGRGEVRIEGTVHPGADGLDRAGAAPLELAPKEGLALLNGTQVSTALALDGLFAIENVFAAAVVAGAMSVDAALGSDTPFDPRLAEARGQPGQIRVAEALRTLLAGSDIRASHAECDRVQDPYSLRCQPQVMGACLDMMEFAAAVLTRESNGVTDNPLVLAETGELLSGGNFHAEPVAFAADTLAIAVAEIGALAERRIALLVDSRFSSLPPFLVEDSGLNSGFMIPQVTAAALAAENRQMAMPASVDSLPTSANQEDHVSMATHAARRLGDMADNAAAIVAIELLAAAQGIDLRRPRRTSERLAEAHALVRDVASFWDHDRSPAPDIAAVKALVKDGEFRAFLPSPILPSAAGVGAGEVIGPRAAFAG
jgi:histidine ammonia-lyase